MLIFHIVSWHWLMTKMRGTLWSRSPRISLFKIRLSISLSPHSLSLYVNVFRFLQLLRFSSLYSFALHTFSSPFIFKIYYLASICLLPDVRMHHRSLTNMTLPVLCFELANSFGYACASWAFSSGTNHCLKYLSVILTNTYDILNIKKHNT